jgi:hypothetical protein
VPLTVVIIVPGVQLVPVHRSTVKLETLVEFSVQRNVKERRAADPTVKTGAEDAGSAGVG